MVVLQPNPATQSSISDSTLIAVGKFTNWKGKSVYPHTLLLDLQRASMLPFRHSSLPYQAVDLGPTRRERRWEY